MGATTVREAGTTGQAQQASTGGTLPAEKIVELQSLVRANRTDDAARLLQQVGALYGIDKKQADTLRLIAGDGKPHAAERAAVYVQLLGAGALAYLPETDASAPRQNEATKRAQRQRLDALIQTTALLVSPQGGSLKGNLTTLGPQERVEAFVDVLNAQVAQGGGFTPATLAEVRKRVFTEYALANPANDNDVYANLSFMAPATAARRDAGQGPRVASADSPAPLLDPSLDTPAAPALEAVGATSLSAPRDRTPSDKIPGTNTPWTPDAVAAFLRDNSRTSERLDALNGLSVADRQRVAEAYARGKGRADIGVQALAFLIQDLGGDGRGNDARMIKDMLNPANGAGLTSEHLIVHMDATGGNLLSTLFGIGGANGEAIERVLLHRTRAELAVIDRNMKATYGKSLRDTIKEVENGRTRDRLLFLYDCQERDSLGEIPQADRQAWALREAINDFGMISRTRDGLAVTSQTDWLAIFQGLSTLTPSEMRPLARAYYRQVSAGGAKVQGGDGSTGPLEQSALGIALMNETQDALRVLGGDDLFKKRMALALTGLTFDPTGIPPAQLEARSLEHSQRVAQYLTVTMQLAEKGLLTQDDVHSALSLIQRIPENGAPVPPNGKPTPTQVMLTFAATTGRMPKGASLNWAALNDTQRRDVYDLSLNAINASVQSQKMERNTGLLLNGEGESSPQARGTSLASAMHGAMLGLAGPYKERTYKLLDLADVPEAERERYRATMREEYTHDTGRSLDEDIRKKFGATITLPGGATIPSRAVALADYGVLTNAQRVIYALYEPNVLGLGREGNIDEVAGVLEKMTPIEKVIVRSEYQRLIGRDLEKDLASYPGYTARLAATATRVFPTDRETIAAQAMLYLQPRPQGALGARYDAVMKTDPHMLTDFLSRNFVGGDQAGLDNFRQMIARAGGPDRFATSVVDSTEALTQTVNELTRDAVGNGLTRAMQDMFSNDRQTLQARSRTLNELTRRAQEELARDGAVSPQTQSEMVFLVEDVRERARKRGIDVDKGTDLAANLAITVALTTTLAVAPATSALWMSVIAGASGTATRAAFGGVHSGGQAVTLFMRDAVKGLALSQTSAIMSTVTPEQGILNYALTSGSAGAAAGSLVAGANTIISPNLLHDPSQTMSDFSVNYVAGGVEGWKTGFVSGLFVALVHKAFAEKHKKTDDDGGTDPTDPGDTDTTGTGPTRPDDPNTPTDRPVTNPDDTSSPGGGGGGTISTPTGPVDRPTSPTVTPDGGILGTSTGPVDRPTSPTVTPDGGVLGSSSGPVPNRGGVGANPSGTTTTTTTSGTAPTRPTTTDTSTTTTTTTTTTPSRDVTSSTGTTTTTTTGSTATTTTGSTTTTTATTEATVGPVDRGGSTGTGGTIGSSTTVVPGRGTRSAILTSSQPTTTSVAATSTVGTSTAATSTAAVAASPEMVAVADTGRSVGLAIGPTTLGTVKLPGSERSASIALRNTDATLDAATIGVSALIVAGLGLQGSQQARGLQDKVAAEVPESLTAMRAFLEKLTPEQRAEQIRLGASALAFSAEAYMQTHGNRLPGNEREPSEFNTVLDLAWVQAGLGSQAQAASVSRAKKVRQLIAYNQEIAIGQREAPTGAQAPVGGTVPGGTTPGGTTPARTPSRTAPSTSTRPRQRPTTPSTSGSRRGNNTPVPTPRPVDSATPTAPVNGIDVRGLEADINAKLGQLASATPEQVRVLSGQIAADMAQLAGNNYSTQSMQQLQGQFADAVVRKAAPDQRQARFEAFTYGVAGSPAVATEVFTLMCQGQGALTQQELGALGKKLGGSIDAQGAPTSGSNDVLSSGSIVILRTAAQSANPADPDTIKLYNWVVYRSLQQNAVDDVFAYDLPFVCSGADYNLASEVLARLGLNQTESQATARLRDVANTLADVANAGRAQRVGFLLQQLNRREIETMNRPGVAAELVKALYPKRKNITRTRSANGAGFERIAMGKRHELVQALAFTQQASGPLVTSGGYDRLLSDVVTANGSAAIRSMQDDTQGESYMHGGSYLTLTAPIFGHLSSIIK